MERTDGKNSKLIQFSNRVKPAWLQGSGWTKRTTPRKISSRGRYDHFDTSPYMSTPVGPEVDAVSFLRGPARRDAPVPRRAGLPLPESRRSYGRQLKPARLFLFPGAYIRSLRKPLSIIDSSRSFVICFRLFFCGWRNRAYISQTAPPLFFCFSVTSR